MSFRRPRRSLPSLPTSLTNPAGCPAEFRQDDRGRLSPVAVHTLFSPASDHGRISPVSGRRSVSPVKGQRPISPNCSPSRNPPGLKHQPSGFGGFVGRSGSCVDALALLERRPHPTSNSLDSVSQHQSLRRHHSYGCTYVSLSPSSGSLIAAGNALKHQNSCPGNLGEGEKSTHAYQSLHSPVRFNSRHSSGSIQHSVGSFQHSFSCSDSDETDTEATTKSSFNHSSIYVRGAGLVHQGSIPCSNTHRKHSLCDGSGCCGVESRFDASHLSDDTPWSHCKARCNLTRQSSFNRSRPGSLSPQQLSPSSSQAALHVDSPSSASPVSFDYIPCPGGSAPSLSPPHRPHPPLQKNESMIYEEDVPVIVRRRGCMLRVRITSFMDADGEEAGDLVTPVPRALLMSCTYFSFTTNIGGPLPGAAGFIRVLKPEVVCSSQSRCLELRRSIEIVQKLHL